MTAEGTRLRSSVVRSFLWLGTSTFVGQFVSWLSTIVVIRLLTPDDYGLMAMTTVFTSLVALLGQMGISSALVQAKELTARDTRQILTLVLLSGLVGFGITYALAPAVGRFYRQPDIVPLIRLLGVNMILLMLYVVPQSLFIREMDFKMKAKIDLWAQILSALVTFTLALNGMGAWALVAGLITVQAVKAVAFNVVRGDWTMPLFDLRGTGRLLNYGVAETADRLLNNIYVEIDKVIVGRFLGNTVLGIYSVAMALASIPLDRVLPIVTQVSFAGFARIQSDMERIRAIVLKTTRVVAFTSFPAFFGMAAVAPYAIPLLLGEKWSSIIVPFQLICLVLPLRALGPLLSPVVFAIGRPRVNVINMAITAAGVAAGLLVGVRAGLLGVCIAWVAVYPIIFFITTKRSLQAIGMPLGGYLAELGFPFAASALMLAAIHLLGTSIGTPRPLLALTLMILFGVLFYSGLVLLLKRQQYAEIRALLQR